METKEQKEKLYDEGVEKINAVYELFKDYYGEERVDLQNLQSKDIIVFSSAITNNELSIPNDKYPFIIVHFPEVTIANENDDSTVIKDLWAKVILTFKGSMRLGFYLNRSTYTTAHWFSDYAHSHIPGISKSNPSSFLSPCLGSGPIKDTISSLIREYNESLWSLFCRELDVYTRTESLLGGPYRRIANISNTPPRNLINYINSFGVNMLYNYSQTTKDMVKDFIVYVMNEKALKFNFHNGSFNIAMDYYTYYITISNSFIKWYNIRYNENKYKYSLEYLKDSNIIVPVEIKNRHIYESSNLMYTPESMNGKKVLTFKGRDILLHIDNSNTHNEPTVSYVLNKILATNILRTLLVIINYEYGRNKDNNTSDTKTRILL